MADARVNKSGGAAPPAQLAPISKLFQYADSTDKLLVGLGTLAAIATGVSQPLQIVIFGDILNSFNQVPATPAAGAAVAAPPDPDAMLSGITKVAIRFVWLGVGVFFTGLAQRAGVQKGLAIGMGTGVMFGFMLCTYSFGMYYGTVLVAGDQLGDTPCTGSGCYDGGRVMTVFSCIIMGAMGLGQAGPSLQAVFSARAAAFGVFQVIERPSRINPSAAAGATLDSVRGEIELQNYRALVEVQEKAPTTATRAGSRTASQIMSSIEATDLDEHAACTQDITSLPAAAQLSEHEGYPEPRDSATSFMSSSHYATVGRNTSMVTTLATTTMTPRLHAPKKHSQIKNSRIAPTLSNDDPEPPTGDKPKASLPTTGSASAPPGKVAKVSAARVWKLSLADTKFIAAGVLGGAVNSATFPLWGVLMTKVVVLFYDTALTADEMKAKGRTWSIAFLVLAATYAGSIVVQNYSFAVVSERLTRRVRSRMFRAMLRQEIGWFDLGENTSGALTTRLATDCAILQSMTSDALNRTFVTAMTLSIGFSIAFYHSWQMTLVLLAIFPVIGVAMKLQMQLITGGSGKMQQNVSDAKAGALLSEAISGIRTVASFHLEPVVLASYTRFLDASERSEYRGGVTAGAGFGFSQGVVFGACGFLFWFGGKLVSRATISFEDMFMVIICIMFSAMSLGVATQNVADTKRVQTAARRVFDTLDRIPSINAAVGVVGGDAEPASASSGASSRETATALVAPRAVTAGDGKTLDSVRGDLELRN
ncbi:hypothetical protein PybrP1_010011, partial [[Pythium] brassicae (nom. inval.)]